MKLVYGTALLIARENYRAANSNGWLSLGRSWAIPLVLLADEPTGNLDFRTGEMIIGLLADLHRSHGLTSIYVTHNLSFANRCDRIFQLDKGNLNQWTPDSFPHGGPAGTADPGQASRNYGGNYV